MRRKITGKSFGEEGESKNDVAVERGAGVKMREYGGTKNKKWKKMKRDAKKEEERPTQNAQ